jgi:hypothetical protein
MYNYANDRVTETINEQEIAQLYRPQLIQFWETMILDEGIKKCNISKDLSSQGLANLLNQCTLH